MPIADRHKPEQLSDRRGNDVVTARIQDKGQWIFAIEARLDDDLAVDLGIDMRRVRELRVLRRQRFRERIRMNCVREHVTSDCDCIAVWRILVARRDPKWQHQAIDTAVVGKSLNKIADRQVADYAFQKMALLAEPKFRRRAARRGRLQDHIALLALDALGREADKIELRTGF